MATTCTDAAGRPPDLSWPARTLVALAVTAALVAVAYFFIDRPVAFFVRDHGLSRLRFLKGLTRPPEVFVLLSPLVLLACLLRRWFAPWAWPEKVALAAAVSTLFTALAVLLLKITFGRPGPDLVAAGGVADGFYFFRLEGAYWPLPSGHTACTLSVTAVAQAAVPRWRVGWWSLAGAVAAALIVLSYHFVGDVLAGAFLGWAVGGTVTRALAIPPRGGCPPMRDPR